MSGPATSAPAGRGPIRASWGHKTRATASVPRRTYPQGQRTSATGSFLQLCIGFGHYVALTGRRFRWACPAAAPGQAHLLPLHSTWLQWSVCELEQVVDDLAEPGFEDRVVAFVDEQVGPGVRDLGGNQRPWAIGTRRSWRPCQTATGRVIAAGSKPNGAVSVRSSSYRPHIPWVSAGARRARAKAALRGLAAAWSAPRTDVAGFGITALEAGPGARRPILGTATSVPASATTRPGWRVEVP